PNAPDEQRRHAVPRSAPRAPQPAPRRAHRPERHQLDHTARGALGAGRSQRRRQDAAVETRRRDRVAEDGGARDAPVPPRPAAQQHPLWDQGRDRLPRGRAAGQVSALRLEHAGRAHRRHGSVSHRHSPRCAHRGRPLARAVVSRPRLLLLDEVLNGLDESNRARVLRWLSRRTGRLPWVLATHRVEDVPPGATHALLLRRGRIVYRGGLSRAPLKRWLAAPPRESPTPGARHEARSGGRSLVRLNEARVYLEGRRVIDGVSLTVRAGEFWVIHGPNGSGKTTLLRTLYGDHGVAAGGAIERAGTGAGVALDVFRRRVGLIAPHLQADHPAQLSVAEVVQSGRHASVGLNDAPSAADRSAARRTLALFGLTSLSTRTLGELSYGQSRRVLFARA